MTVHPTPPVVAQTLSDSCWAAVLESWSRSSQHPFPAVQQQAMIAKFGEGRTGGITPARKIPEIARAYQLAFDVCYVLNFELTLMGQLPRGLVFVARLLAPPGSQGAAGQGLRQCHAELVYGNDDNGNLLIMDPNGGRLRRAPASSLTNGNGVIVMWKR